MRNGKRGNIKMMIHQLRAREKRAKRRALRNNEPSTFVMLTFTALTLFLFFCISYWWCTGKAILQW
nr:MAG TPA: hypothetical protein [Caudoviricetes sp.]DAY10722.1 MAG TPA: hypothetical protein [Caudoviricetes sp.]